ncbi:hypothetical protein Bca52824_078371 [Brassica carinata]|uniref:MADS-box domain-containing protein n=1 Tax=Brassica carinata TaxID=52824 RepID=A0A8X7PYI8_BRACI|nr:hypothetical protein Bca52824_078371 [Brassica carinata]
MGRQRIPMVKIKKETHRQVTFSKRRAGLFKKASELCTLCGAEIGIIVYSPAKKPFSFGHPSVESVLDRYLSRNDLNCELNMLLTQTVSEVEEEKKKGQAMADVRKGNAARRLVRNWWEGPVDEMNVVQLQVMKCALEELRKIVVSETNTVPFKEVKEDVFGFLDTNKVTAPSYMNTSSGLSNAYHFGYGNGCF